MYRRTSVESAAGAGAEVGAGAEAGVAGAAGAVGRLVDSSQADDRRMIALVRARRLLYARNNMPVASYYARVKQLWEEVAAEMGRSVPEVRRKWSHIRNSYSRHLRNEVGGARTGRGRVVSRWYLADELEFLKEHMATDTRTLSSSSASLYGYSPATFLKVDMSEAGGAGPCGGDEPLDVKPFASAYWLGGGGASPCASPPAPPPPPPLRLEPKQEPHSVYSGGEDSSSSFAAAPDEELSYFQFFRGVYGEYSQLCARRRRLFRRQCLELLHAQLDQQDDDDTAAPLAPHAPHAPAAPLAPADEPDHILPNDD